MLAFLSQMAKYVLGALIWVWVAILDLFDMSSSAAIELKNIAVTVFKVTKRFAVVITISYLLAFVGWLFALYFQNAFLIMLLGGLFVLSLTVAMVLMMFAQSTRIYQYAKKVLFGSYVAKPEIFPFLIALICSISIVRSLGPEDSDLPVGTFLALFCLLVLIVSYAAHIIARRQNKPLPTAAVNFFSMVCVLAFIVLNLTGSFGTIVRTYAQSVRYYGDQTAKDVVKSEKVRTLKAEAQTFDLSDKLNPAPTVVKLAAGTKVRLTGNQITSGELYTEVMLPEPDGRFLDQRSSRAVKYFVLDDVVAKDPQSPAVNSSSSSTESGSGSEVSDPNTAPVADGVVLSFQDKAYPALVWRQHDSRDTVTIPCAKRRVSWRLEKATKAEIEQAQKSGRFYPDRDLKQKNSDGCTLQEIVDVCRIK